MSCDRRVLTVANRKGGTGKTTTVVNLAAEMAARGRRVLVVDLDTQGHVATGLGVTVDGGPGAHDVFSPRGPVLVEAIRGSSFGPDVIPARTDFDASHVGADHGRLARALSDGSLAGYERILIDTPPSIDAITMNALLAADGVLIPLVPHHLAGEGVRQLSRLFFRAAMERGDHLGLMGLLPIMTDRRVRLQRQVLEELGREFGERRILRGIRSDIRLAEAFAEGCPVRAHAPRSRGAMDYYLLAEELRLLPAGGQASEATGNREESAGTGRGRVEHGHASGSAS